MKNSYIFFILFVILAQALSACGTLLTPPPPATPTSMPTPTTIYGPAEIVQAFWDALNNQDFDTAMALVADDIQATNPGLQVTGKVSFQVNLKKFFPPGTKVVISDVIVTGDTVTYNWQIFVNDILQASGTDESMIIKNGKIVEYHGT